ncbi:MAG TPA: hypothetical protein VGD08_17210 [Stellaceae bacterium]|jgi:hypothetical protein
MEAQVKDPTITAIRMFFEYGVGAPDIVRDRVRQAEARRDDPAIRALQSVLREFERGAEARDETDRHGLEAILLRWLELRRQIAGRRGPT